MDESSVVFKGSVNGLTIVLREEDDFEDILHQINQKIQSAGKFFKGAVLAVKYKGKKLSSDQEKRLYELMANTSGAKIKSLEQEPEDPHAAQQNAEQQGQSKFKVRSYYFKGIDEGMTKFHKGTVRSGQRISFDGNVVIIGDVNPGGVVEASGNIMVMGSLRGVVHAGADGNRDAVVVALNLQPTQLRIADVITRAPDGVEARNSFIPERASIKDDNVYIERYLPQFM